MLYLLRKCYLLLGTLLLTNWILAQTLTRPSDYFQQEVAYRIDVTLNDEDHTLSVFLSLDYINNSPDTLNFIWFHLWPNAYRSNETAFARQEFEQGSTRFYFAKDKDRGYIDSLDFRSGDNALKWEYHHAWIDVAKVYLAHPLAPGDTVTIETPFLVKIPNIFSRLGHTDNHYEITQWYPKPAVYDRDGWHAMPYLDMGEFYSEFGTFDVHITLPREYVVMATGDLPQGDPDYEFLDSLVAVTAEYYALKKDDGKPDKSARKKWLKKFDKREFTAPGDGPTKTLHFHQEKVHDFAWFADKRYMVQKGTLWVEDSTRAVTVWCLHRSNFADLWEESLEYAHDAAYWYGQWYGTYPYNHVSAVSGDMAAGGGMEYPNITVISMGGTKETLEDVIMHEVGHNWHYGIFGYNERLHPWLDEGLTVYSEIRYWYAKYGEKTGGLFSMGLIPERLTRIMKNPYTKRHFQQFVANFTVGTHDDQPMEGHSSGFEPTNYGTVVYYKSSVVFDFLEHYLGPERNQAAWDAFTRIWSFAHPGPEDLRAAFETISGEDLSWFFDDIVKTNRRLDYGVSRMVASKDVVQVTITNYGEIEAPVEVATLDREGAVLESRWLPGFSGSRTITFDSEAVHSATTDPGGYSPDVDHSNDYLPLIRLADIYLHKPALRFLLSAPEPGRSQLYFIPMLSYCTYSGLLPGTIFYGGVLPPSKNHLTGSLFYSLKQKRLAGGTGLAINRYRLWGTDKLTGKVNYASYPDYSMAQLDLDAIFRERAVSSPALQLGMALAWQQLTEGALDNTLWDTGTFISAALNTRYWNHTHALLRWDLAGQAHMVSGSADELESDLKATILQGTAKASYRYARQGRLYLRGWLGHTLTDKDLIPNQYRFWLSGGLDTDFSNPLAFNRTGSGTFRVYHQFYIPDEGPAIRALNTEVPGITAWALNLDVTSKYPLALFADIAGTNNGDDESWQTYTDAGIIWSLGPIKFIVPLWHSWEPEIGEAPYEGWRIGLSLPSISL
ncbi:MAG: M1 family metallopeptidase [Candidatus Neomarinimicrobiota bacterium]